MKLTGWRIVPEAQAERAFDGEGARIYGGRWNSPGVLMVYASEHLSLAALEVRVHIESTSMRKRYVRFSFDFDEKLMRSFEVKKLPADWRQEPAPASLRRIGDAWIESGESAVLAVPSVIIPEEKNYLLNPRHPDFAKIIIAKPRPFSFDPRLL